MRARTLHTRVHIGVRGAAKTSDDVTEKFRRAGGVHRSRTNVEISRGGVCRFNRDEMSRCDFFFIFLRRIVLCVRVRLMKEGEKERGGAERRLQKIFLVFYDKKIYWTLLHILILQLRYSY